MSENNDPKYTRRDIIKKVMIGGVLTVIVLPRKWTRPIIETVVTPAHAAASVPPGTTGTTFPPTTVTTVAPTTVTTVAPTTAVF